MADLQGMDDCVRIAAVDLGTVSSRLALARVRDGRIVELTKHSIITDMGRGVDASGAFDAAAIERVEAACAQFAEEARAFGAAATCVTLTSAARDASNADELLDRLAALGFIPQVIPGEVEARLTFYGVAHDFPGERIAVADPGGGSTEIVVGSYLPDAAALELERVHSFNIGCRRLTDRFFTADPPGGIRARRRRALGIRPVRDLLVGAGRASRAPHLGGRHGDHARRARARARAV